MAFTAVPDLTSSFLSIQRNDGKNSNLIMTQLTGGATVSKDTPLYLEGGIGYIRYDPIFVASNGVETRDIPAKWNIASANLGIGYDIHIAKDWVLRPMVNLSLGQIASDLSVASRYLAWKTGRDIDFLNGGKMNAYGVGGSLMLDYESVTPTREIDLEIRYTNIRLHAFGGPAQTAGSDAIAEAISLYARKRAPTGIYLLDRPLRTVIEAAHTTYLGSQRGLLGFNYLTSVGGGFEIDTSSYPIYITRTRIVARYAFGQNIKGFDIGLAVSF